jgi:hypothetical protein
MGSSSEDARQLKYFGPMKATDSQIYAAAESMLTLPERTDPTGVLPAYMLRHRLADQMVRTSDLRIKSIVEVELLSPVSMCDIFVVPVMVKNFGYSVTTSHQIVARYSYSIRHKTQTNMPRLTERFDDLKPGAVVPADQISKQFQLADVSPPRGPREPRPRRRASAPPPPPPNPAHLAQQAGGVVPRDELTKGKAVCIMLVSGGVNYAYAGVVCAPPHGVRVRVRFRDGAILLCKLDRMLAIVLWPRERDLATVRLVAARSRHDRDTNGQPPSCYDGKTPFVHGAPFLKQISPAGAFVSFCPLLVFCCHFFRSLFFFWPQ